MPGHGPLGKAGEIEEMDQYLSDLETHAARLVKDGVSEEEFASEEVPQAYRDWWFDRFYAYNLGFALAQASKTASEAN